VWVTSRSLLKSQVLILFLFLLFFGDHSMEQQ
jgi:hypothetical protein